MKEKIKKIVFGYLPGYITGLIVCGGVSVLAMTYFPSNQTTYDNSESGLESTNVQGAIDELYATCIAKTPAEEIIENAGLEKDPYECRYFFTGQNPNNYVTFNNETAGWRIISVECDGTIKIMRIASIGDQYWDRSGSNNWTRPSTLNTYLNSTYYNGLNSTAQNQIVAHDWKVGLTLWDDDDLANTINSERNTIWNGKIGLATTSEYLRTNSNISLCGTHSLTNDNYSTCRNTTWMFSGYIWWTISPSNNGTGTNGAFYVDHNGTLNSSYGQVDGGGHSVRPAIYLSSSIKITGGDGSQSNPYTIE